MHLCRRLNIKPTASTKAPTRSLLRIRDMPLSASASSAAWGPGERAGGDPEQEQAGGDHEQWTAVWQHNSWNLGLLNHSKTFEPLNALLGRDMGSHKLYANRADWLTGAAYLAKAV